MPLWTKYDLMTACKASDPTSNFLEDFNNKPNVLGSAWILKNWAPAASYLQAVRAASG